MKIKVRDKLSDFGMKNLQSAIRNPESAIKITFSPPPGWG
jgi:hypothetical protein